MIKYWLQKYFSVVRVSWIHTLEYRANALVGIFAVLSGVLIEFLLWNRIFITRGVDKINGFTLNELIIYIFFALMVGQLKSSWINSMEMIEAIRNGDLNKYLIRPLSFFSYNFALFIGNNSIYLISYMFMCIIFPFIYPGMAFNNIYSILGFVIFLIFSVFISYSIYFIMVCFAFWFGEVRSLIVAYNLANSVISGQLIPLKMFPDKLLRVLEYTPIPYLVDIPVSFALGYAQYDKLVDQLFQAIFWIIILPIIGLLLYRIGIKRYEGFGG